MSEHAPVDFLGGQAGVVEEQHWACADDGVGQTEPAEDGEKAVVDTQPVKRAEMLELLPTGDEIAGEPLEERVQQLVGDLGRVGAREQRATGQLVCEDPPRLVADVSDLVRVEQARQEQVPLLLVQADVDEGLQGEPRCYGSLRNE